ncbi:MAG: NUDIX domain-containing protein [Acidobacteria bacterium]|nr:NUDIX domain-containing protein [Acidobacteriota bacterium]MBV9477186.1 NUDIX domain-containing protein [Acidobacteriota bacterium]
MAGTLVTPLPAASAIVVRDAPLEVLLLRRHEKSSFMPNAWVFPGGIAEPQDAELGDGSTLATMRITAARETFEESGLWLGAALHDAEEKRRAMLEGRIAFRELIAEAPIDFEALVWTSRWITPVGVPKRFDTYFFLAAVPRTASASVDREEMTDFTWVAPHDALRGDLQLVFPTRKNLEAIATFTSVDALLAARRSAIIEPIEPVLVNGKPVLR